MALYIDGKREWHVGEPVPRHLGRVVTFQADGDELDLFIDAMHASRGEANGICWDKGHSFRALVEPKPKKTIFRIWYKQPPEPGRTDPQFHPTGQAFSSLAHATFWTKMNPAYDGEWSIREENA